MANFISMLERLRKLDLPLCFFGLSLVLFADAYCRLKGIPIRVESLEHVPLQHWFWFAVSALAFYLSGPFLKDRTLEVLIALGAIGWIERFLDSPQRRADAAETARNSVSPSQLRLFALQHDNKTAMALFEQHQKAELDEIRAELWRQCHAFCLLLALLMDIFAQGLFMQPLTQLPNGSLELFAARSLFAGLFFLAFYFGMIRGLTWSPRSRIYLPGHEELGISGTTSPQSAWPYWLGREGGPISPRSGS